jgi:hypothetical protein
MGMRVKCARRQHSCGAMNIEWPEYLHMTGGGGYLLNDAIQFDCDVSHFHKGSKTFMCTHDNTTNSNRWTQRSQPWCRCRAYTPQAQLCCSSRQGCCPQVVYGDHRHTGNNRHHRWHIRSVLTGETRASTTQSAVHTRRGAAGQFACIRGAFQGATPAATPRTPVMYDDKRVRGMPPTHTRRHHPIAGSPDAERTSTPLFREATV